MNAHANLDKAGLLWSWAICKLTEYFGVIGAGLIHDGASETFDQVLPAQRHKDLWPPYVAFFFEADQAYKYKPGQFFVNLYDAECWGLQMPKFRLVYQIVNSMTL